MAKISPNALRIKEATARKYAAAINILDDFVTDFVAEYNFQKYLKPEGSLQSLLGYDVNKPLGTWQEYPCYGIDFICDPWGILQKFGNWRRDFSKEEIEKNYLGRFKVAVDQAQIQAAKQAGIKDIGFPHEKIISVQFNKDEVPKKIMDRIKETAMLYNAEFGFNPDYDGFTLGDLLDQEQSF
ncbi:hypothetical protein HY494_00295 [Candidatus Woesearchaeota archaeon]|nr:hypothetical protein [Candidatus Woesearchaeota archaeon]